MYELVYMYVKAVGNKGVLREKMSFRADVQLFRTAVLCHVINRSVTSSDTSSQERVDKTTRKI